MQRPSQQGRAAAAVPACVSCRAEENHHQERPNLDIPPQLSLEEELPSGEVLLLWMPSCCGQSYTWVYCLVELVWAIIRGCLYLFAGCALHHRAFIAPL